MLTEKDIVKTVKQNLKKNLISHIGAFSVTAVCIFALALFTDCLTSVVYNLITDSVIVFTALYYVFSLFGIFMAVPLFYGLCVFEYNCANGEKPDIKDLFTAFSSFSLYVRSFSLLFHLIIRLAFYFIAPGAACYCFFQYSMGNFPYLEAIPVMEFDLMYTLLCIAITLLLILAFIFSSKYFTALYIAVDRKDLSVSDCFFAAKLYNRLSVQTQGYIMSQFIGIMLITPLTFGVSIIYTLPLVIFTGFFTAKQIHTNNFYFRNRISDITGIDVSE